MLARLEVPVVISAPETRTVISDDDDDRAIELADGVQVVEQFAEQPVDEFDLLKVPPLGFGDEVLVVRPVAEKAPDIREGVEGVPGGHVLPRTVWQYAVNEVQIRNHRRANRSDEMPK